MMYPIDSSSMTDFRNAAALHNMFHSVIISDAKHSEEIAQLILDQLHKSNLLFRLIQDQNLNHKTVAYVSLDDELEGFPVLRVYIGLVWDHIRFNRPGHIVESI